MAMHIFYIIDRQECITYSDVVLLMWFAYLWQTIKTNVIGTLNMLGLAKRVKARCDNMLALVEATCL